jgi:hypothetical protein
MKKVTVSNGRENAQFNIDKVEAKYGAKFVGQFCLKTVDGTWAESPADIYYQPNPNVSLGHTHYFGLIFQRGSAYITKGDSAVAPLITAAVADDGEIIYSAYRHHYNVSKDRSVFIDGGRDYTRGGCGAFIMLKIVDGEFYEVEQEDTDKTD